MFRMSDEEFRLFCLGIALGGILMFVAMEALR